jgi:hypothetical protein
MDHREVWTIQDYVTTATPYRFFSRQFSRVSISSVSRYRQRNRDHLLSLMTISANFNIVSEHSYANTNQAT